MNIGYNKILCKNKLVYLTNFTATKFLSITILFV